LSIADLPAAVIAVNERAQRPFRWFLPDCSGAGFSTWRDASGVIWMGGVNCSPTLQQLRIYFDYQSNNSDETDQRNGAGREPFPGNFCECPGRQRHAIERTEWFRCGFDRARAFHRGRIIGGRFRGLPSVLWCSKGHLQWEMRGRDRRILFRAMCWRTTIVSPRLWWQIQLN